MKRLFSRFTNRGNTKERGAYMVIIAIGVFSLMAFFGLAVDIGKLQRQKLRLQRAVDSAGINAVFLADTQSATTMQQVAYQVVYDNLISLGFPVGSFTIAQPVVDNLGTNYPRQVSVNVQAQVPLSILSMIPGYPDVKTITASTVAKNRKVYVALALDTSGSMCNNSCPCNMQGTQPNCTTSQQNCFTGNNCTKLVGMKNAASAFVDVFTDNDFLSVVQFSTAPNQNGDFAKVVFPLQQLNSTNRNTVKSSINQLRGIQNTATNGWDGLIKARQQLQSEPRTANDFAAIVIVSDGAPWNPFGTNDPSLPSICNSVSPGLDSDKRRYVGMIREADAARTTDGVAVFTIGLGPTGNPVTSNTSCNNTNYNRSDPFQDADCDNYIHNYLLARLAFDSAALSRGDPLTNPPYPQPNFTNNNCVVANNAITGRQGRYFQTPDPGQLQQLLVLIGRSIKAYMHQ